MKRIRFRMTALAAGVTGAFALALVTGLRTAPKAYVNIYDWYGVIPKTVLMRFEKETGITVRYDVYDSNEMLEAKLLASNCGYDVVFPSASPYVTWQVQAGIYEKLDRTRLPDFNEILDPTVVREMEKVDPGLVHAIPLYWGTIGYVYNKDITDKVFAGRAYPADGWGLLFDPEFLRPLAKFGVSLLEEGVDVIPVLQLYLGHHLEADTPEATAQTVARFRAIRPYIKRFSSFRVINDLVMGDSAVAQAWSGEALQAVDEAAELGHNLHYVIPKEGTLMWIDTLAIPKGAPNTDNAYTFIRFILQPEIMALITANSRMASALPAAKDFLPERIRDNQLIYPPEELRKKLVINPPPRTKEENARQTDRNRLWAQMRMNNMQGITAGLPLAAPRRKTN